jgi:hypothetical protein
MGEATASGTTPKLKLGWADFCFVALGSSLGDRGAPGDIDDCELMDDEPLGDLPYNELRSLDVDRPRSSPPAAVGMLGDVGDPDALGISYAPALRIPPIPVAAEGL